MANQEHLNILLHGVKVWNKWRREHPEIRPDLSGAILIGATLSIANLDGVNLGNSNLSKATLIGANFSNSTPIGAIFMGADLSSANFTNAILSGADISNANLLGVKLIMANLTSADLSRANIIAANIIRVNLSSANFSNAQIAFTTFADTDLSVVKGLETVIHSGPSFIGIDTIYLSKGNIPEVFLRGAGVPDVFITQMRKLTAVVDYSTCFISFTEADDSFSEKLYNDFQAKNVRCWRWKEDAKWGTTLMRSIDAAVHDYDKVVVICSEQSLQSPAVIREIERALQREDALARQGEEGEVLFPIRLDDYVFTGWSHHRKADVTTKTIGDFRGWKNHDEYQKAFTRLLRDLQP
ncbi:MAG: toll/interleukin-1 receptor domain-containing protein [Acidobacteriota bacterium]|nr:toll/interleukin-1 receptor domain-containing protein [Acidobacteriota bacterium]